MRNIAKIIFSFIMIGGMAAHVSAQHGYRVTKTVNFKKGEVGTTVSGTITNRLESHEYILRARKGQTLLLDLKTQKAGLGFDVMSPDGERLQRERFPKHYTVELDETGEYHIFVSTERGSGKYKLYIQAASDI